MTANVVQMAYVGETPWHGEGNVLTEGADIETWTREAGLDFEVKKAEVLFGPRGLPLRKFGKRFVTHRADDGTPLGIVSDRFQLVQPREVVEFYREFVASGGMKLETAGTLLDSRRVWGLASLDAPFSLPGGDVVRPYFLLATGFGDGTGTTGTFTSVRVVCCNTLQMAMNERDEDNRKSRISGFSVGHNAKFDRAWAQQQVENLISASHDFENNAALLASTGISNAEVLRYFVGLVGVESDKGELTPQSKTKIDRLVQLYRSGPGADLPTARGTAWGALNAITHYADFDVPVRKTGSRFVSGQFGPGNQLKNRALEAALELAVAA